MDTVGTSTLVSIPASSGIRKAPPGLARLFFAAGSAFLLIASFPSFNLPWCAWVALVPWLIVLRGLKARPAFWWSYLVGLVFFLGSIWWLTYVTVIGWLVLCAYLALYVGLFGWLVVQTSDLRLQTSAKHPLRSGVWSLTSVPAAWVAMEFARSHLLSGLGWNLLAYSQTPWTRLIQFADVTGAWGVSFLIVLVNVALAAGVQPDGRRRHRVVGLVAAAACLAAILGYGAWRIPRVLGPDTARVAVVQGNIPQEEKWDAAFQERILARYDALTRAAAATSPDLIVWPETSVPALFESDDALIQGVAGLAKTIGRPLLVGAPALSESHGTRALTNSAFLIAGSGAVGARYDKLHLVPFGEFIPLEQAFPWLRGVLPPIGDFVPGQDYTVFHLSSRLKAHGNFEFRISDFGLRNPQFAIRNPQFSFSVLICFEDIFPDLARRFVREGARLLLVVTNDAWFGPTGAAYQHAQASTFRAVELRVPVARAANTGWSGCIDPAGRWMDHVHDASGRELFVPGVQTCNVPLGTADSVYRRWGDWFAWLCLLVTVTWLCVSRLRGKPGDGEKR